MSEGAAARRARPSTVRGSRPGDLGRRVAARRQELGLTRELVAGRAGMAPEFLEYLERRPAEVGAGTLMRLAGALGLPPSELLGGSVNAPPGPGRAARRTELVALSAEECRDLLGSHGVGRLAFTDARGVEVLPVNYAVVDGAVVYRTGEDSPLALPSGLRVGFEVDRVDDASSQGWSVLVTGTTRHLTRPDELEGLAGRPFPDPWPGGVREYWVRVEAEQVTGRRVQAR